MTAFEWFDRSGRPLLRWICITWIAAMGSAIAYAFWRSAMTGVPVPDMSGGLTSLLLGLAPLAIDQFTRSNERRAQIAAGQAPGPFVPSPPLQAPPDDTLGPRPAENRL